MRNRFAKLDIIKLMFFILKRCWVIIICAEIGFGVMYWRAAFKTQDTYTASGIMYVYNVNPNMINYGYASSTDLIGAVQLVNTYLVVIRSNKVMDAVVDRLHSAYPGVTAGYISSSVSMGNVSDTGVLYISCRTDNPQKSADFCNAIMDVAPNEIIRVVGAGAIEIIDYATAPSAPDSRSPLKKGVYGAAFGAMPAVALLTLMFLLNQKVDDPDELAENYTLPVLASVKRIKSENKKSGDYLLKRDSEMGVIENYAKLRMNLQYILSSKDKKTVMVTSSVSGEGKSTIASNLAISIAMTGKRVLLIDADMRRGGQHEEFGFANEAPDLAEVLKNECSWKDAVRQIKNAETMHLLPRGITPNNPSELMESQAMKKLLAEMETVYDLVVLDVPPINIVSDPLELSNQASGAIFVVRQHYSDHREIRKALMQAELTGLNLLGFVFYGENLHENEYYKKGYYNNNYTNIQSSLNLPLLKKAKENKAESSRQKEKTAIAEAENMNSAELLRSLKAKQMREQMHGNRAAENAGKDREKRMAAAYRKKKAMANRKRRSELYRKSKERSGEKMS